MQMGAKLTRFVGGERMFMAWLRENKFLMSNNEPYQRYVNYGWFIVTTRTIHKANPKFSVPVTRITFQGMKKLEKLVYEKCHKPNCP